MVLDAVHVISQIRKPDARGGTLERVKLATHLIQCVAMFWVRFQPQQCFFHRTKAASGIVQERVS